MVWSADIHRREEREHDGWRFVIVTVSDVYRAPDQSMPVPRRLDERWCRFLPTQEVVRRPA